MAGFEYGAFKQEGRLSSSCIEEGWVLFKGVLEMARKSMGNSDTNDLYNLNDAINLFVRKCNYLDTIESTVLLNLIVDYIDYGPFADTLQWLKYMIRAADLATILSDVVDFDFIYQWYGIHHDYYNLGNLGGKITKIVV